MWLRSNIFTLLLLVSPCLSTASHCKTASQLLGQDETSLIQAKKSVAHGNERLQKVNNNEALVTKATVLGSERSGPSVYEGEVAMQNVPDLTIDLPVTNNEAREIVGTLKTQSLTSFPRQMATVNLALMSLSVQGDFVETGVFQGGTSVLMAKVLQKHDQRRKHWAADSFQGLPEENAQELSRDQGAGSDGTWQSVLGNILGSSSTGGRMANFIGSRGDFSAGRDVFERTLEDNGLVQNGTHTSIEVLSGFFNETLPYAPIPQISFLRLDGDMYVSTMDSLNALYPKVNYGGYVYVDDYGYYIGCKHAIDDYRKMHGVTDTMYPIFEGNQFAAVWWRKGSHQTY